MVFSAYPRGWHGGRFPFGVFPANPDNGRMEVSTVPREAPAGATGALSPRLLRFASDDRLVALVRGGSTAAFEVVYSRHHRSILSFCRNTLGSIEEGEDAAQHTVLAAYRDL